MYLRKKESNHNIDHPHSKSNLSQMSAVLSDHYGCCSLSTVVDIVYRDGNGTLTKFGVSWTTIRVIQTAVRNFVAAWNEHRLPGCMGGIPNLLAQRANQTTRLDPLSIPTTSFAIALHEQLGGQLTRESSFGRDPLAGHPQLASLRERDFSFRHPSMEEIMQCVLHGDSAVFKQAIMHFIELTRSYSTLVQP